MIYISPKRIIAIGFVLVMFGFLVPLLMVVKVIEASFVLGFVSYGASISGLLLGLMGAVGHSRLGKD